MKHLHTAQIETAKSYGATINNATVDILPRYMRGRIKEKKMKTELKKIELNGKLLKAMKAEKYFFI